MQDLVQRQLALPAETKESLRELAVNTRQTVDALDHVVWAVNPMHDTLSGMATYLAHAATSYLAPLNIFCRLDLPLDWPEIEVRAQVRHHLILAFREALQNIAEHSGADTVTFSMRHEAPEIRITLADNGCGLPDEIHGPGREGCRT